MEYRKKIIILGTTGSIGASCLDIIRHNPDLFEIVALQAHKNVSALEKIAAEFGVKKTVLSSKAGDEAILALIRDTNADIVVNGISGSSGLLPSKVALESGKNLALANKETIVMAGNLIKALADHYNMKIIPVDSEHSAVFNLIEANGRESLSEIILTASGGPFRTWDSERLSSVTPVDALKHPTWSMGSKITIDSASLANKGLEVIEACRLFDIGPDRVKVVVHPQSLIHSFIRTNDGVLYAQISHPDMRHPILNALTWPKCMENHLDPLTFEILCEMRFEQPRYADFPLLGLAYRAAGMGGRYTIAYNAANEIAVEAFLGKGLPFTGLAAVTARVLDDDWSGEPRDFADVMKTDTESREKARLAVKEILE